MPFGKLSNLIPMWKISFQKFRFSRAIPGCKCVRGTRRYCWKTRAVRASTAIIEKAENCQTTEDADGARGGRQRRGTRVRGSPGPSRMRALYAWERYRYPCMLRNARAPHSCSVGFCRLTCRVFSDRLVAAARESRVSEISFSRILLTVVANRFRTLRINCENDSAIIIRENHFVSIN